MKTVGLAAIVFCVVAEAARAQESAMSLGDCLAFAYQHNDDIRVARAERSIQDERVLEGKMQFLPSATLDAFYTRYDVEPSTNVVIPAGAIKGNPGLSKSLNNLRVMTTPQDPYEFKVSLVQPIFTSGKLYNALQLRRAQGKAVALEADKVKADVGFAVVHAFYDVLLAEQATEANQRLAELADAVLASARDRGRRGAASRIELLQAEADHARTMIPVLKARNDLAYRKELLKHLMGWEAEELTLQGDLRWRPYSIDIDQLRRRADAERPDLRLLDQQIAVKERELKAAMLANTPSVNAVGAYEFLQHQRLDFPDEVTSGGVAMTWPIFDGLAQIPRVRAARLALDETRIRRQHLKRAIQVEVERAWGDFQVAEAGCLSHQKLMEAAGERVQVAEANRGGGTMSLSEVAGEHIALLNARLLGAQLVFDYILAKAAIDHVVGAPADEQ